jgi:exodeoxyribonuclease V beta subunit
VFLPFICNHRPTKADDSPLRWHDDDGRLHIAFEADDETLALADRERLGEDLRKLYVALTRARHATFLGLAPLKNLESSAIGQLLANGKPLTPDAFGQALADLRGDAAGIHLAPAPAIEQHVVSLATRDAALGDALTSSRSAREHWWIASYSALRFSGTAEAAPLDPSLALPEPSTSQEATALEVLEEPHDRSPLGEERHRATARQDASPRDSGVYMPVNEHIERDSNAVWPSADRSLHRFPRGPGPGTFLHGLLEWAGRQGFASVLDHPAALEDTLARRCNLRGWSQWIPALQEWLLTLLATPLPSTGGNASFRLAELNTYQVELEFWFAAHQVDTQRLDALVRRFTLAGTARSRAESDELNGMLKGFIDLVFEHGGRYYVLDWKSNHLGPDDAAYTPQAMTDTVAEKRYDLQYALYLLALHRLLKARLPDYDYDRHVGGSLTVFLRGTNAPSRGVHAERPPRALIEALDALFQGADATRPAPETSS